MVCKVYVYMSVEAARVLHVANCTPLFCFIYVQTFVNEIQDAKYIDQKHTRVFGVTSLPIGAHANFVKVSVERLDRQVIRTGTSVDCT